MQTALAVDPGREKCGVAAVSKNNGVLWQAVLPTEITVSKVAELSKDYHSDIILVGNGTSSQTMQRQLQEAFADTSIIVQAVNEYRTTDLAKIRYWRENPPQGWRRLLPTSMQVPPVPVDDYVAIILAERYLNKDLG